MLNEPRRQLLTSYELSGSMLAQNVGNPVPKYAVSEVKKPQVYL
jgi:hypothetical protein